MPKILRLFRTEADVVSVWLIADKIELPRSIVLHIRRTELNMREVSCEELFPYALSDDQTQNRIMILTREHSWALLEASWISWNGVVTWCWWKEILAFEHDPANGFPRPRRAGVSKSCSGHIRKKCLPSGQTVNAAFYIEALQRLRNRAARVRPEIAMTGSFITTMRRAVTRYLWRSSQWKRSQLFLSLPITPNSRQRIFSSAQVARERKVLWGHRERSSSREFKHSEGRNIPELLGMTAVDNDVLMPKVLYWKLKCLHWYLSIKMLSRKSIIIFQTDFAHIEGHHDRYSGVNVQ